jgi:protein SCO1/2
MSKPSLNRFALITAVLLPVFTMSCAQAHEGHDHHAMEMEAKKPIKLSTASYTIPSVKLVREDGKSADFAGELNDDRAVILNFVYTSCTEICPLTSETFTQLQDKLGKGIDKVHMVSISIDPEQDTPATLKKFAKKYKAKSQWNFYTGTVAASVEVQKAFDAYRGDKMNHVPATYLRASPDMPWLRIDGFASSDELLSAYKELTAAK